jgi:hypothetical protein
MVNEGITILAPLSASAFAASNPIPEVAPAHPELIHLSSSSFSSTHITSIILATTNPSM